MAGSSMTITYDETANIKKILVDWKADDATAAVSGTTKKIVGSLLKGVTDPGAGAVEPDNDYNIIITDEEGLDVLGQCEDDLLLRHESLTQEVYFWVDDNGTLAVMPPVVCDILTISVNTAGNSNEGQLIIYYIGA